MTKLLILLLLLEASIGLQLAYYLSSGPKKNGIRRKQSLRFNGRRKLKFVAYSSFAIGYVGGQCYDWHRLRMNDQAIFKSGVNLAGFALMPWNDYPLKEEMSPNGCTCLPER